MMQRSVSLNSNKQHSLVFLLTISMSIEQDPDDYLSYFKRATAYLSLGKTNLAIEDFTKILNLKPGFSRALLQRAKLYLGDGEFTLAKHDLEDYQKISPSDDAAQLVRFCCLY
jgi:DnaJ family protein C protein 3